MNKIRIPYLKIILTVLAIAIPFTYWHYKSEPKNPLCTKNKNPQAKKLFIITGEHSGDRLGTWFAHYYKGQHPYAKIAAVGGHFLKQSKIVSLYKDFRSIEKEFYIANGPWSLIKHLPTHINLVSTLFKHVQKNEYTDVVLIDYPFINIPLARKIKRNLPHVKLTYIAPPELWFWGRWGIDHMLKAYCDKIIVLYPHEVAWYKNIGLTTTWLGYPFYNDFKPYIKKPSNKNHCIALVPASRPSELKLMMPLLGQVVKAFHKKHPEVKFILPLAESLKADALEYYLKRYQLEQVIKLVDGKKQKMDALSSCCLAISKPGTVTLELALLGIPTIVTYTTSWTTYLALKLLVRPSYLSLPNLLESKPICTELIQGSCNVHKILHELERLYTSFCKHDNEYKTIMHTLTTFQQTFDVTWHKKTKK